MININAKKTIQKIKSLRQERGWSQQDMADRMHMSQANYSKIENSEADLTLGRVNDIANAMEIDFWDILATDENIVFNNENNTTSEGGGHIGSYVIQSMSLQDKKLWTDLIEQTKREQEQTNARIVAMEKQIDFLQSLILKNKED